MRVDLPRRPDEKRIVNVERFGQKRRQRGQHDQRQRPIRMQRQPAARFGSTTLCLKAVLELPCACCLAESGGSENIFRSPKTRGTGKECASVFDFMNEQIVILDFGSQYTQVIARRIRECNVYSLILRYDTPAVEIAALKPSGIILSGGPSSVYAKDAPLPDKNIFALGVPVLGICYGVQLFAQFLGGQVEKGQKREYGKGTLRVKDGACPLFANLPESLQVWNSHGDKLTKLPSGFKPVAVTENSEFAAIENRARKFFGLQFHPEVVHTPRGREIIANFVHRICGCGKNWTMRSYVEQAVDEIRAQVGGEKVILGLSGGVDSSVAAALLHKAIGSQLTCIFVNNGVLRARRGGSGAGGFRAPFQNQAAIRRRREAVFETAQRRDRPRTQTQNHRQDVHRSFSGGDKTRGPGEVPRAGHALSRRDRIRAHRRQSGGDDQEPPQRRRPAEEHEVSTRRAAEMPVQG